MKIKIKKAAYEEVLAIPSKPHRKPLKTRFAVSPSFSYCLHIGRLCGGGFGGNGVCTYSGLVSLGAGMCAGRAEGNYRLDVPVDICMMADTSAVYSVGRGDWYTQTKAFT